MFSWLSDSKDNKADETISNLFYYAVTNNNKQMTKLMNESNIDLNSDKCKDRYSNTLLHIVANGNNVALARSLILCGLRKDHSNSFGERAVDIALKNNNLEMVRVLTDMVQNPQLLERIAHLESQTVTLRSTIQQSETNLEKAKDEIKTLKRKRCDDCDVNTRECKKLKTENEVLVKKNETLTKDNGDLQTTIKNLRQSFKK